jgi:RNA polymerase sigma-70 factor (family 1)
MLNTDLSDFELWNEIRNNNNDIAFKELFDRYWVRLYKTANQYLKDKEASEEVVHDVFLNIWARRHTLDIASFQNFLLTAIRYQVYNRMRAAKLSLVYVANDASIDVKYNINNGEIKIEEQELQQELRECLNKLPKRCQEIFHMSRMNNLSNQEISSQLGISKRSVENQITFALKHLRKYFKHMALFFF